MCIPIKIKLPQPSMFLFLLLSSCLEYQIDANSSLVLLDEKKEGEIMKFDYYELTDIPIKVVITDELDQTVYETTNMYGVLYTRAFKDKKYKITMHNLTNKPVNVVFRAPDADMEIKNAFGAVDGDDPVKEFNNVLQKNITNQRRYLEHQAENIKRIEINGKRLVWFFIFELCFCVGLCVYYQRELIGVFEKKSRI